MKAALKTAFEKLEPEDVGYFCWINDYNSKSIIKVVPNYFSIDQLID